MKFAKLALALVVASLQSSLASASGIEDPVLASFERDMNHEPSTQAVQTVLVEHDPLLDAIRVALQSSQEPEKHAASAITQPSGVGRNGS